MQTQRYIVCGAKEETKQTHAGVKEVEVELPLQTRGAAPVGPSLVYL